MEMMVAIAVFSVVMVTAMSALLNVIDANNKARAIKTAINNISFALEGISKDMRMGTDYACARDNEPSGDCSDGGNIIKYKSPKATGAGFVYYKFDNSGPVGVIQQCIEVGATNCDFNGPYQSITSGEVDINNLTFYVLNSAGITNQPKMIMTIKGEAGVKDKIKTEFDLQTSVSQRKRILPINP